MNFIKGLFLNKPRGNAPVFVKGSISIKYDDFMEDVGSWVNSKGYVNIDLLENKAGELYLKPSNYDVKGKEYQNNNQLNSPDQGIDVENIPF